VAACASDDTADAPTTSDSTEPDAPKAGPTAPDTTASPAPPTTTEPETPEPPNMLIVIADDYGIQDAAISQPALAEPNADVAATPTLSALADDGVVFDHAWANPTCSPTRAALLTGRYGHRTGVNYPLNSNNPQGWLDVAAAFTLPEAVDELTGLDYRSANIGKWHLSGKPTDPNDAGWDYVSGIIDGAVPSYTAWPKVVQGELVDPQYPVYATTDQVDEAIEFTSAADDAGEPWLVSLALVAPHDPFHVPPADLHSDQTLVDDPDAIAANPRPYYDAAIEAMDAELGRLIDTIDLDDTYVIFLGDNGTPQGVAVPPNTAATVKASLLPGGTRVPMFIAGPGIEGGRRSDAPVHAVDVFATVLDLVGADLTVLPADVAEDSVSIAPLLSDDAPFGRDWNLSEIGAPTFPFDLSTFDPADPETWPAVLRSVPNFNPYAFAETAFTRPGKALTQGSNLLIAYDDGGRQLYDLSVDPWALDDLLVSAPETATPIAASLEALLAEILAD
jgi:arylsulfatase A-like enzyme